MDNPWLKVENIVEKGEIARFVQLKRAIPSFVTMFSKSCLLQSRQKASIWGKGLNKPKLGQEMCHAQGHSTITGMTEDGTWDAQLQIYNANHFLRNASASGKLLELFFESYPLSPAIIKNKDDGKFGRNIFYHLKTGIVILN